MTDIIERARTQLIINHAFFASVALKRPIQANENIKTADVNARGQIRYNPTWLNEKPLGQAVFVVAHECMHYMQDNFTRMGDRNPKKWNRATDAVNNEILVAAGVGTCPPEAIRWPNAENMSPEEVYEQMPDEPGDNDPGTGGEPGNGDDMDHSASEDMSEAEKKQMQGQLRTELAQAAMAAKQMGQMPGVLERLVRDILQPKTPWHDKLERFMTQRVKVNYSWSKPNKRFMSLDIYMPSISGVGLGDVAIIRDTSGSVSPAEQSEFTGHVNRILETCNPTRIYLIDVDTRVSSVEVLTKEDLPFQGAVSSGGGTDMRVGLNYVDMELPDVDCCILLTDGYTPWPESMSVPTMVATTGAEAPASVGETVKLEISHG